MSQYPSSLQSLEVGVITSPTSFDILFEPMLQVISTMRRFVLALYERVLRDEIVSSQMALVTHELLENAVKYNTADGASLRICLLKQVGSGYLIEIRTRNHAAPEHIRIAERLIARVRDTEDPDLLYLDMIRGSAEQTEGSGLGLARIRAETPMTIDVYTDGDEIEVVAHALLLPGDCQ